MQNAIDNIETCCDGPKVLAIKVVTLQGEQTFHVCVKHRDLEYFRKYKISEVTIQ